SLVNLATAAGVSVEWLATGRGVQLKSKLVLHEPGAGTLGQDDTDEYLAAVRRVPHALGQPPFAHSQVVDYLGFKANWLHRALNADVRNLVLVEVLGDSMAPTIKEGDLILADLRENRFRFDGVYLLRAGEELVIKRLQRRPDDTLSVRGDNQAYEPQDVSPEAIAVIGRVIWVGGRA
ncbi:MAG: S24 family peptidase, partial [Candidatus Binataceae bacterium]